MKNTAKQKAQMEAIKKMYTDMEHIKNVLSDTQRAKLSTFHDLMRAAEADKSAENIVNLAEATAYSTFRVVLDPDRIAAMKNNRPSNSGCDELLSSLRAQIAFDHIKLDSCALVNNADRVYYTADGDTVKKTEYIDILSDTISDGYDIVQTACLELLERIGQHETLEAVYPIKKLDKRTLIRKEDSAAWHDEDTNDVHETMRACRAYIDSNRTVHADAKNMYTYIEEHATAENSADAVLYRRYGKCLDIGGYVFDANGRATVYTGNATIAEEEEAIIESMHLTQKQARVLTLRRQGYGIRSIGQYYGVSFQAIAKTMSQIRKKAADIGLKEEAEAQRAQREAEAEGAEMIAIVNAYDRQRAHEAHDSAKRTAERRARQSEARRTLIDRVAQREAEAQREAIDRTEAQPQSEAEAQRRAAEAEAERRAAQSEAERRAAQRTARRTLVDRVAQREAEAQRAQREAERRAAQSEAEREAERRAAEARAEAETIRSAWTEANNAAAEAQRAEAEYKRISGRKFRTWTERRAAEAEAINHWNEAERRAAEAKRAAQRAQREAERRAAQSYTEAHR